MVRYYGKTGDSWREIREAEYRTLVRWIENGWAGKGAMAKRVEGDQEYVTIQGEELAETSR